MPKYIDADALKAVMVFSPKLEHLTVPEMRDILTEIDSVPDAYVKYVRYGRWVSKEGVYGVVYCSICDFELKIDNTPYCPNCGAEMLSEPYEPPKSWMDNPWCNAVDKAMETEPPKEEDDAS